MATKDTPTSVGPQIQIRRLGRDEYSVPIIGVTPLIAHKWAEKSKNMMLEKQQTKARPVKEFRVPEDDFNAARYRLSDGSDGMPATAFKAAIVHAARLHTGITQVALKQMLIVIGDGTDENGDQLVRISYDDLKMRTDTPRNSGGTADLRFRPQYDGWSAMLQIVVVSGQLDEESLLALVDAAGMGGVGDWRPTSPKSATGSYGTFRVAL
jgi:hypothetical protein